MKKKANSIIGLLFCMSAFVIPTGPVTATSCAAPEELTQESLDAYSAIFSGWVIEVEELEETSELKTTFEVTNSWKGVNSKTVDVYTTKPDGLWGRSYSTDIEYLVFAGERDGMLRDGICGRTTSVVFGEEDIEILDQLTDPASPVRRFSPLSVVAVVAIVLGVGYFIKLRSN